MSENLMMVFEIVPVFVIIAVLEMLMPKLTRKGIAFGVKIPEEKSDSQEIKGIYKIFLKENIVISILFIIISGISAYYCKAILLIILLIAFIGLEFVIYISANRKVKKLKESMGWNKGKKQVVSIDMDFSKDKGKKAVVSPLWFLIPVVIIAVNIITGLAVYKNIPGTVVTHWNAAGKPDGWVHKSYGVISLMPCIMICLTAVLFFAYKIIGWSKQQISSENPEESIEKNRRFRFIWSGILTAMTVFVDLIMTVINFNTLTITNFNSTFLNSFSIIIVILVVIASVYTGQGGSRIKVSNKETESKKVIDRDDDKNWKIANSLYFNPDDPALFVEKRFGIGWTLNFGNKMAIAVIILLIIFIVAMAIIPNLILK